MFCKSFFNLHKKSTYKEYSTDVEKAEQKLILANTIFYFIKQEKHSGKTIAINLTYTVSELIVLYIRCAYGTFNLCLTWEI